MTLVEAVAVLTVTLAVAGQAVSAVANETDRVRVTTAQGAVLGAYRVARSAARTRGRPASVVVTADSIVVRSMGLTDTVVVLRRPGPGAAGVGLSPAAHSAVFGPSGLAMGAANVTHRLTRGAVARQVVVSRLGRARAP